MTDEVCALLTVPPLTFQHLGTVFMNGMNNDSEIKAEYPLSLLNYLKLLNMIGSVLETPCLHPSQYATVD